MQNYILHGERMTSRESAHAEIAGVLGFPPHYGNNLDALWDMISAMDAQVILRNPAPMLNALGVYGCRLLQTFFEATKRHAGFSFRVE